ncbi:MAG TPA: hypothetical protein VN682_19270 [Terriglobales bacterium]|nr:hypothetical protein [Terriglobales bacterium]
MTASLPSRSVLSESRQAKMLDELAEALRKTSKDELGAWGKGSAALFGRVTTRRVKNVGRLFKHVAIFVGKEIFGAFNAGKSGGFKGHAKGRVEIAKQAAVSTGHDIWTSLSTIASGIRSNPCDTAPVLVVTTLAFLAASGGPDGDGGVPDLDLMGGIGAHRSIFTHSILSGAAIETFLFASAALVGIVHKHLRPDHDEIWDSIAANKDRYMIAVSRGASLGIAYHLFIDSTMDVNAYHGLPISMPMSGHEAIIGANAAAEAIDVGHKSRNGHD